MAEACFMSTGNNSSTSSWAAFFVGLQKLLPQHGISRLVGRLTASEQTWIARPLIRLASFVFSIDLQDAERQDMDDYHSFNDFFTRALQAETRPIPEDASWIISPVDGAISQFGKIEDGMLLQAKGNTYTLDALLGADPIAAEFTDGQFATIYLAPSDYHRIHMPFDGKLLRWIEIPGELFSVNALTETALPNLFCRNERLVCLFETSFGPALVVLVGALIVASIETVFDSSPSPFAEHKTHLPQSETRLFRGEELGRFLMGSTVIVCFPPNSIALDKNVEIGMPTRLGQALARIQRDSD
jgi:phosphatidylserine decarboxylase